MSSSVGPIKVPCKECGVVISRFPSGFKGRKYGIFCTNSCLGKFRTKTLTGSLAANFKEGSVFDRKYIRVLAPWHPNRDPNNKVHLHRLIFEAHAGRFLKEGEIVHHIDGNAENNNWNNLEVMTQSEHASIHLSERNRKCSNLKR